MAIIGAGRMGRRHVRAAQELGLEVTGVCDRSAQSLEAAAHDRNLSAAVLFEDSGAMFRRVQPECVIVATTTDTHHAFTSEAVASGAKYVLCEKPMASSLAQCDDMIEICRQQGVRLAINHHFRFSELHQATRCILNSEELGGVTSATVVAGNVGMAMIGTHLFELFAFITGETLHEVTAWLSPANLPNPRGPQFEDPGGAIRLMTEKGKRFYLEAGTDQGHGITVTYAAKFGQVVMDLLNGSVRTFHRQDKDRDLPSTQYGTPSLQKGATYPPADAVFGTKAVLQNLLDGGEIPDGNDSRQALAALVAAYLSNENGHRPVCVNELDAVRTRVFPWP